MDFKYTKINKFYDSIINDLDDHLGNFSSIKLCH